MITLEKRLGEILRETKYLKTPLELIKIKEYDDACGEIRGYRILNDSIAVDFEWSDYLENLGGYDQILLLSKEEFEKELDIILKDIKNKLIND